MADTRALDTLKFEANAYAKKGDFSLALPLFEQLQVIEPKEPLWSLRVGEILRRIGHPDEAAPAYRTAARLFAEQREFIKAMASCKFVLLVAPDDKETKELLSKLYEMESQLLNSQAKPIPAPPAQAAPPPTPAHHGPPPTPAGAHAAPPPPPPQALGGSTRSTGKRPPPPPPQALALPAAASPALPPQPPSGPTSAGRATPSLSTQRLRGAVGAAPMIGAVGAKAVGPARARAITVPLPIEPASSSSLRQRLPSMALFQGIPPEIMREVLAHADVITHASGTIIAEEGEVGGPMFVIVDGRCSVTRRGRSEPLAELGSGEIFGELSLVTDDPRTATVTATADAQILALSREAMHELIKRHPPILLRVLAIARDRLVDGLAKTSPLFVKLDEEERNQLLDRFEFREIDQDGVLTEKGEKVEAMHIILAGNVAIEGPDGKPSAMLGAGDVLGELALLGDQPALATTWATRKTWALALPEPAFKEVVMSSPRLFSAIASFAAAQASKAMGNKVIVA